MSSSSHDYERLHGTQAEQAKRQSTTIPVVGGPFHLVRHVDGLGKVVMTNSVRTTRKEADDLVISECTRTGVFWSVEEVESTCEKIARVAKGKASLAELAQMARCENSEHPEYCPACLRPLDNDGRITVRLSPDELSRLGQLLAERAP